MLSIEKGREEIEIHRLQSQTDPPHTHFTFIDLYINTLTSGSKHIMSTSFHSKARASLTESRTLHVVMKATAAKRGGKPLNLLAPRGVHGVHGVHGSHGGGDGGGEGGGERIVPVKHITQSKTRSTFKSLGSKLPVTLSVLQAEASTALTVAALSTAHRDVPCEGGGEHSPHDGVPDARLRARRPIACPTPSCPLRGQHGHGPVDPVPEARGPHRAQTKTRAAPPSLCDQIVSLEIGNCQLRTPINLKMAQEKKTEFRVFLCWK